MLAPMPEDDHSALATLPADCSLQTLSHKMDAP